MSAVGTSPASLAELPGHDLGSKVVSYGPSDAILYAIAVGARADELALVYERDLRPLPTMAWPLSLWAVEEAGRLGAYDPIRTLHVGQNLSVHRALSRAAEVEMTGRISAVYDKGSAALLEIEASSDYFDTTATIFVPGGGGFGGDRGPGSRPAPTGEPDASVPVATWTEQAALYRLTGDLHPLHVDPQVAAEAGFQRPILHGLCTLGSLTLAIARALQRDPADLAAASARLAAPVYPGQELAMDLWKRDTEVAFAARAEGTDVVKGGVIGFAKAST